MFGVHNRNGYASCNLSNATVESNQQEVNFNKVKMKNVKSCETRTVFHLLKFHEFGK